MKLVIEKAAARRLLKLPARRRLDVLARLEAIAEDPFAQHANVRPLRGEANAYRLRIGDRRAVYRLDRASGTMRVALIEPRGSVY